MDSYSFYSYWILTIFSILSCVKGDDEINQPRKQLISCKNGIIDKIGRCSCQPCWTGENCDIPVNKYAAEFTQSIYEVDVTALASDSSVLFTPDVFDKDIVNTCNGDSSNCPCAEKYFSIQKGNDESLFTVDPNDGSISLSKGSYLEAGREYMLQISVRNKISNEHGNERKAVVIFRAKSEDWYEDPAYRINQQENAGYSHHIVKRGTSAAPDNVTFILSKLPEYASTSELWIGSRVKFKLDISFPNTETDMLVELFTPDNETTVMIVCDVIVTPGTGLQFSGSTDVSYESRTPGSPLHDRAIINLGIVTVTKCDIIAECTLTITYTAITVDDTQPNGTTYWVSAGAEYNNLTEIWVGQASFLHITDDLALPPATSVPTFNFTGPPGNFPIGSAAIFQVEIFLPFPAKTITFDAFAPLNTSSVASICSAKVISIGDNCKCGMDESAISTTLYPDDNGLGNNIAHVNAGTIYNQASREDSSVNSSIIFQFVVHLYNNADFLNSDYWIGSAVEMGTDAGTNQIWAGQFRITPAAATGAISVNAPVLGHTYTPDNSVNVDEPKTFLLTMELEEGTTSTYDVTVQTEINNNLPKLQLCSISIKSVGGNMPCVVPSDKTPVYQSTVGAPHADKGTLSLNSITNLAVNPGNATENTITLEVIVTPLQHVAVTSSSSQTVTITVRYGIGIDISHSVPFTVGSTTAAAELSNTTNPSFNMTYFDGQENVNVGTSTKVFYEIKTNKDVTYPMMNIEAIMPLGNTSSKMSVCRARLISAGKNLPCVAPEWINSLFSYSSKFNDGINDRAILNLAQVCNKEAINDEDEDILRFEFDIKVENHEDLLHGQKEWVSIGNMYRLTGIWVGQLALYPQRPATIGPASSVYISLKKNSTLTTIPIGMPTIYSLLLKVAPGESVDLKIIVTSTLQGLSICGVRLKVAGDNFPCATASTEPTYEEFSNGDKNKGILSMIVTNTGSTAVDSNDYFDANSLIFEIIVKLSSDVADGASYPFTVDVTTTTSGSAQQLTDTIVATSNTSGFDTTITQSGSYAFAVGEIAGNDTEESVAKGEGKRFIIDLVLPESTIQKISVSFITPVLTTGLIEICDAAVISVGSHFPCIDKKRLTPTFQKRTGSLYNDIATVDLGYVCGSAVSSGTEANNKVQVEAVARILPDANVNNGDEVHFHVTVNTNDQQYYVAQINMTVTDAFTEKQSSVLLNNNTVLTVNATTTPIPMTVGQITTFPLVMYVPAMSTSKIIVDASVPINGTSIGTVKDIRLISTGRNIICLYEDSAKGIVFTPVYNSTLENCENDKGYVDFGIVTNTGLSYRRDDVQEDDDAINVEVDVILNDNEVTEDGAVFPFSFGAKLGNYIFITESDIVVARNASARPVLNVQADVNETVSTSASIVIDAELSHDAESRALAVNATVLFYLPPYLLMDSLVANISSYTVTSDSGIVSIVIDQLLFCDVVSMVLTLRPNTSISVPDDIFTDSTVVTYQSVTNMFPKAGSIYNNGEDFASELKQVNFSTTVTKTGVCDESLGLEDGRIDDCQIFSSVEDDPARPSYHGRLNGTSAWSAFKRGPLFNNLRFWQVYFGNKALVTKITLQHKTGFQHYPKKLTLTYSDDGYAWQNGDVVSLTVPYTETTIYPPRLVEARYLRIYVTEDTVPAGVPATLAIKFGLFGCNRSLDGPTDICSVAPRRAFPTDYYERSFGIGNGKLIVCDVNPQSDKSQPACYLTTDGATWKRLSGPVASILGYDQEDSKWFGYAKDKLSTLMSIDDGENWRSASRDTYLTSREKTSFAFGKQVKWTDTNLDSPSAPHSDYQLSNWGATYHGMMQKSLGVWTQKLEWEKCCI